MSKAKKLPLPRNDWSPANRLRDIEDVVRDARARGMDDVAIADEVSRLASFAVPNGHLIRTLNRLGPIVDLGAGNGYWTYRLARAGGDVVGIEPESDRVNPCHLTYRADHTVIGRPWFTGRALLMVWPTRAGDWPAEAVRLYQGSTVAYIGDPAFVGTATPELPEALAAAGFIETHREAVGSWASTPDELIIYRRDRP